MKSILAGGDPPLVGRYAGDAHAKQLQIVLGHGDARDISIRPSVVLVRSTSKSGTDVHFAWTGPGLLRDLLRLMNVRSVEAPVVAFVPASRPYSHDLEIPPQIAWFTPRDMRIDVRMRVVDASVAPFSPRAIPIEGPLAMPEPRVWKPEPTRVVHREHERPMHCTHCGVGASRHRAVGSSNVLVCESCGRSFVPR